MDHSTHRSATVTRPTVEYAVESFLTSKGPTGENVEANTYSSFVVLLQKRLLPFAKLKGITHIETFENLDVTTKFKESWINLQPSIVSHSNQPLADTTQKVELERLRCFFRFCQQRKWLVENCAKKLKVKTEVAAKFGMEQDEEDRVFAAMLHSTELTIFCSVMRRAGLRISDTTALNESNLVTRASGVGWAIKVYQKKTKEWVYIPITASLAESLQALPFKGEKDGVGYWFWTCVGKLDTAINNWYTRITKVVDRVEAQVPFAHPVTPHCFRHTFCITHLNAGTDIKFVSRWAGHQSTSITEQHYGHAIRSTRLASEDAYDESLRLQEVQRVKWAGM